MRNDARSHKPLWLVAALVLGAGACSGGNTAKVVCLSANEDACITAAVDYDPVAGVRLPSAPDEAVAAVACNILPNDLFLPAPADVPPTNTFSEAEPTFHCPASLTGAVLGTCEVLASLNPDYTGPTTAEDFDITGFHGILTLTDAGGMTAVEAQAGCDSFVPPETGELDHFLLYSTWVPKAP